MRDALSRLMLVLDLVSRVGDWFIGRLYQIRDGVAAVLQLHRIIPKVPWLFSTLLCPDMISISRILGAISLVIRRPLINSFHVTAVIVWSGLSDWLDGYIATRAEKAKIQLWGLRLRWPIATGKAVDPAADGLTFLFATIYLVMTYPIFVTWLLLVAVILELIKLPACFHAYRLVRDYCPSVTMPAGFIRKARIGEAKTLCLFISVILIRAGLRWQNQRFLYLAIALTSMAMVLGYLTTARYIKRFLNEFPDLLSRWYQLPGPTFTWLMILVFTKQDISRLYPVPPAK